MIFALPMLMTMEMWALGFHVDPWRLALLLALMVPLLVRLSRYGGIRTTQSWRDDLADALVVVGMAALATALILALFGVITADMPLRDVLGKVGLQTFPAAIGAMLARNQLGERAARREQDAQERTWHGELFLMGIGALFLSLNISPTEEVVLIAYKMNIWQEIALLLGTIILMHIFVYRLEMRGSARHGAGGRILAIFLRFTLAGYALVLLVSCYTLWTFGRMDGTGPAEIASAVVVLSFPGAIGASAARLIA